MPPGQLQLRQYLTTIPLLPVGAEIPRQTLRPAGQAVSCQGYVYRPESPEEEGIPDSETALVFRQLSRDEKISTLLEALRDTEERASLFFRYFEANRHPTITLQEYKEAMRGSLESIGQLAMAHRLHWMDWVDTSGKNQAGLLDGFHYEFERGHPFKLELTCQTPFRTESNHNVPLSQLRRLGGVSLVKDNTPVYGYL